MKRYFYVSFAHANGFASATFTTTNRYLDRNYCQEYIANDGIQRPIILAITEMTESDYNDFIDNKNETTKL